MLPLDPLELARRQLESDRDKTSRFPRLFERKLARMSASPLALLRGAAPLFYAILADRPALAGGPEGEGWLSGDMHLENFGAFRPDPRSFRKGDRGDRRATFDLNDFDEAIVGPLRFDVLRLTTSLILGGRELGADGVTTLELCDRLLDAYTRALFGKGPLPASPGPVQLLVRQVRGRTRKKLLEGRTRCSTKIRRFVLDDPNDRYRELPRAIRTELPRSFARYIARNLGRDELPDDPEALTVLDGAFRIAGTGSLGSLRVAVLVRGKGGQDGEWIFDLKEQGEPAASSLLGKPLGDPATRVVTAVRACLVHPPRMLGTTTLAGRSMFVRRLAPQEDKLELTRTNRKGDVEHAIHHTDLGPLAGYLGALLGRAHRHGARRLGRAWSAADRRGVVQRAITIAGLHEAIYLSVCRLRHAHLAKR